MQEVSSPPPVPLLIGLSFVLSIPNAVARDLSVIVPFLFEMTELSPVYDE